MGHNRVKVYADECIGEMPLFGRFLFLSWQGGTGSHLQWVITWCKWAAGSMLQWRKVSPQFGQTAEPIILPRVFINLLRFMLIFKKQYKMQNFIR